MAENYRNFNSSSKCVLLPIIDISAILCPSDIPTSGPIMHTSEEPKPEIRTATPVK
jgi:hypothetical protein